MPNHSHPRPTSRLWLWLTGSCLLMISTLSHALSLGEATLHSRLNQPLLALIPVSADTTELEQLQVALGSPQAFKRAGITREEILYSLKFELLRHPETPQIRITSSRALREPLLEFVIQLQWGNGSLVRPIALFLSP